MPQFDLANFAPQLVWLTIFFAILYFGIVRMTLPKLTKTMDAREGQVNADLAKAEQAKSAADEMAASYTAGIEEAHAAARAKLAEAKSKAAASIETAVTAGNAIIAEKAAAAEATLATARTKALDEIQSVASDAAVAIVERLTGRRPDIDAVSSAAHSVLVAS